MSPLTIFLARLLGLYCLVIALAMAANKRSTLAAVDGFLRSAPLMMLASVIALALGLAMVIGHNVWSGGVLPVVVTLFGWTSLIKGAVFLFRPPEASLKLYQALGYDRHFSLYIAATFLLGLYLTLAGFSA
jgi:hypothetical protein